MVFQDWSSRGCYRWICLIHATEPPTRCMADFFSQTQFERCLYSCPFCRLKVCPPAGNCQLQTGISTRTYSPSVNMSTGQLEKESLTAPIRCTIFRLLSYVCWTKDNGTQRTSLAGVGAGRTSMAEGLRRSAAPYPGPFD